MSSPLALGRPFLAACRRHMRFLEKDHGYVVKEQKVMAREAFIQYQNDTTAVYVGYEPWDLIIIVKLIRLVDRELPPLGLRPSHTRWLRDLVQRRAPSQELPFRLSEAGGATVQSIEEVVRQNASALKQYASDVLAGDFSAFETLGKTAEARPHHVT